MEWETTTIIGCVATITSAITALLMKLFEQWSKQDDQMVGGWKDANLTLKDRVCVLEENLDKAHDELVSVRIQLDQVLKHHQECLVQTALMQEQIKQLSKGLTDVQNSQS